MERNLNHAGMFTGTHEAYVKKSALVVPEAFKRNPVFTACRSFMCLHDAYSQCLYLIPDEQVGQNPGLIASLDDQRAAARCRVHADSDGCLVLPRKLLHKVFGADEFPALVRGLISYFSLHADH